MDFKFKPDAPFEGVRFLSEDDKHRTLSTPKITQIYNLIRETFTQNEGIDITDEAINQVLELVVYDRINHIIREQVEPLKLEDIVSLSIQIKEKPIRKEKKPNNVKSS